MSGQDEARLGTLVQDYARARWGGRPDHQAADRLGAQIDPSLRERIDMLGLDAERLLTVAPETVLGALRTLEREAASEDQEARGLAARIRVREEAQIHGAGPQKPAQAPGRSAHKNAGQQRPSTRQRRGRQRGQR